MAFTIALTSFAKKINSTARPVSLEGFSCELKSETDIMNPTVVLNVSTYPGQYNYAYIAQFERYYFIDRWRWANGLWEADLSVDVLATWKAFIGNSEQYVLRSRTDYDNTIVDNLYPTFAGTASSRSGSDFSWPSSFADGWFILNVLSSDAQYTNGSTYYALNLENFNKLRVNLFSNIDWLDISDISQNLQKAILNPIDYVTNVFWIPFTPPTIGTTTNFKLGYWSVGDVSGRIVSPSSFNTMQLTFTIPQHPQTETRGVWLTRSSYTEYELYIPPFGPISIPSEVLAGGTTLYIMIYLDPTGGRSVLMGSLSDEFTTILFQSYANVSIPISLGQAGENGLGTLAGFGTMIGGGVAAGLASSVAGGIAGVSAIIGGAISSMTSMLPVQTAGGSGGSMAVLQTPFELRAKYKLLVNEDIEHFGRPYCKKSKLNLLPGYILCKDADVEIAGTSGEIQAVNDFLNGGFFYE